MAPTGVRAAACQEMTAQAGTGDTDVAGLEPEAEPEPPLPPSDADCSQASDLYSVCPPVAVFRLPFPGAQRWLNWQSGPTY